MNEEIEALLKKADESIRGAKLLFDNGLFGFAVSRAYYAMFYVVSAVLLTKGLSFSKHTAVVAAFGQHFVKTNIFEHKFHRYLVEAFEQRQIGDYEVLDEITKETAQRSINRAIEFIAAVKYFIDKT
ncbi:MAG: HEPN domain-containing protein [Candidatus Methanomarinus sp.]|uniref:HEPN domain-containing protein n=1 Tax=Candidatus Methanomarinus sp. TaxID=3386244 RepID=A0AC61S961_9EURY|nr:MAG: HEPN domain protein [ANME-2 cluster archaeon HR1]TKY91102.1 MAG: HEPN domain-containing protein [ANME-2 cluster archaeon]